MTQIGWLYNEETNTWAPGEIPGGDGSPTVSVLGPFRFNYDDPDIDGAGVAAFEIATGTIVIEAFAITSVIWAGGDDDANIQVGLGPTATWEGGDWKELAVYEGNDANRVGFEPLVDYASLGALSFGRPRAGLASAPSTILVYIEPGGGTYTAGQADLYALVYVPA